MQTNAVICNREWYERLIKAFEQEPCEDCISRQAVLECFTWTNDKADIWNKIKELPPVNPQESKTDVLDKIRAEIQGLRNCSCNCLDGIIDDVEDIIDKYTAESEDKE